MTNNRDRDEGLSERPLNHPIEWYDYPNIEFTPDEIEHLLERCELPLSRDQFEITYKSWAQAFILATPNSLEPGLRNYRKMALSPSEMKKEAKSIRAASEKLLDRLSKDNLAAKAFFEAFRKSLRDHRIQTEDGFQGYQAIPPTVLRTALEFAANSVEPFVNQTLEDQRADREVFSARFRKQAYPEVGELAGQMKAFWESLPPSPTRGKFAPHFQDDEPQNAASVLFVAVVSKFTAGGLPPSRIASQMRERLQEINDQELW